jgi:ABC-type lipoprotein export system ATPase subunit
MAENCKSTWHCVSNAKQILEGNCISISFQSLNDEGVTIIMITHDANVASHAKKTLHIIDGEIIENKQGGTI